jgi:hypothetical protein
LCTILVFLNEAVRADFCSAVLPNIRWKVQSVRASLDGRAGGWAVFDWVATPTSWSFRYRWLCALQITIDPYWRNVLFQGMSNSIQMRTVPNRHASRLMLMIGMAAVYAITAVYWTYLMVSSWVSVRRF